MGYFYITRNDPANTDLLVIFLCIPFVIPSLRALLFFYHKGHKGSHREHKVSGYIARYRRAILVHFYITLHELGTSPVVLCAFSVALCGQKSWGPQRATEEKEDHRENFHHCKRSRSFPSSYIPGDKCQNIGYYYITNF